MARVVFVLGAGASSGAGVPVMKEFLGKSERLMEEHNVQGKDDDFRLIFEAIGQLQLTHSKGWINLDNLESVFAAFEFARLLGGLPGRMQDGSAPDPEKLVIELKELIRITIEESLVLQFDHHRNRHLPNSYADFVDLLKQLTFQDACKPPMASVITFNYDLALDWTMGSYSLGPRYFVCESIYDSPTGVPLLKLHGSLNWCRSSDGERILPFHMQEYGRTLLSGSEKSPKKLQVRFDHQKWDSKSGPVLVPPTFNKGEYHRELSKVWVQAARELKEAEFVFVIGYSCPRSDEFFPYLYSLGTAGGKPLKGFWIYDINPNSDILEKRFKEFLGTDAKNKLHVQQASFLESIPFIAGEIRKSGILK